VNVPQTESMATDVVGSSNCRAIIMRGENLFAHRMTLVSWMRRWVASEPDILWQFVLAPACEEPLDLLETMLDAIRRMPPHWLDRLVSPPGQHVYAARRVLILLPRARPFDASWCAAAEGMLANAFH